jgi:hypothetical protein
VNDLNKFRSEIWHQHPSIANDDITSCAVSRSYRNIKSFYRTSSYKQANHWIVQKSHPCQKIFVGCANAL